MIQLKKLSDFSGFLSGIILALLLSGCVNGLGETFVSKNRVVLAEQHPNVHFEQEVMIVRISQILLVGRQLSKAERADLHFERGVLYDSLGLWGLAR